MPLKPRTLVPSFAASACLSLAACSPSASTTAARTIAAQEAIPDAGDAARAARLDAAITRALADQRIVGTVVVVARDGRVVYRRAAGFADRETGTAMREDSLFLLASVTKPIVATAALRLVEQGRLHLEDPVTRWLPDFRPRTADGATPTITVHHLLTHTAGLTYDFLEPADGPYHRLGVSNGMNRPDVGLEENLRRIAAAPLSHAPGTRWGYSMATDVLGAVVARAAGKPLPAAVESLVTGPLDMEDTAFSVVDRQRLVTFYGDAAPHPQRMGDEHTVAFQGAPVHFVPGRIFDPRAYPSGGAGMAGTADDVLVFLEALRRERGLLQPSTASAVFQPHVGAEAQTQGPGWGFGYVGAVLVDPVAAASPQSAGTVQWGGAYGHSWFVDRAEGLSVVALTNTTFEGMVGRFTTDVRDAVYGRR